MRATSILALTLSWAAISAVFSTAAEAKLERVYVGTFTAPANGRGAQVGNRAEGIYVADLDTDTGKLTTPRLAAKGESPSWLVYDKARGMLYATNEYGGFTDPKTGTRGGSLSAYHIDKISGALTPLPPVGVANSTNLKMDPSGHWLIAASYADGVATLLPVAADGTIGAVADVYKASGPRNPDVAADQPRGNQMTSSHANARIHGIAFRPGGKYVALDDAGLDVISIFTYADGKLTKVNSYPQVPGSTPRHSVWDAKGRFLYTVYEQDVMVSVNEFDPATGALTQKQRLSALPPGFAGSATASEILLSNDGKNLYAGSRFHDSIAHFAVKPDGTLRYVSDTPTGTNVPRGLVLDPSGRFLLAGGQNNDSVAVFRLDPKTGEPKFTGNYAAVPSPAHFAFTD
jgi:6-phosphogluconolactonase (cycloisomerase 2 family)